MVALVLNHAGVETVGFTLYQPALGVEAGVADARMARHHAAQAGHRQAALPTIHHLFIQRRDHRVDQHRGRHGRRIGVAHVARVAEDHQLQIDTDLRRRQTSTVGRGHGLEHVGNQYLQLRRAKCAHGRGHTQQARVAHPQNFMHAHGWVYGVRGDGTAGSSSRRASTWATRSATGPRATRQGTS